MTRKNMNRLEQILNNSQLQGSSDDLDRKILDAARESAEQAQEKTEQAIGTSRFAHITAQVSAAAAALIVTVFTLAAMQRLITPDPSTQVQQAQTDIPFIPLSTEPDQSPLTARVERPPRPQIIIPPTQWERDLLLKESTLPDPQSVIAIWELPIETEYIVSVRQLDQALEDIQGFIEQGELDDARERYGTLVQTCGNCQLPTTLEGLIIGSQGGRVSTPPDAGFISSA